ncbi:UNVERIFIED_CONTAM: hypothetical protein RMT77_009051 [Armadillidium vulgare]
MFRERINFEKEENEKHKSKRHPFRSSELQKGSKEDNIKHRYLDSVSEKTSTISNPSSSSEKCINFSKEKKIQSLHEMAMRLTKTLAEEEEALDEKLKSLKNKSSSHNEKKNSKENKILTKATDSDNLSVEEVIEKLKNILPDPKVKPTSVTNHFLTNKNNIFVNEANNDLDLRFYKSERDVMGITQLGLSSDPVKFSGLRALNVPHFLNSVQSPIFLSKNHMSNLFRGVQNQYSPEQIKAATIIQAYYRGYQVRKITSLLLKKAGSKGHGHKRLKDHSHKDIPISQNIKSYNNNSAVLPKHIKPFYNLAETGDINTFTDSYLKTKTQNYVVKESQKLNKHAEEKSQKVPISIPPLERSFIKNDNINSMLISRDLGQSIKKDSNISDEVDLKNFCTNKILKHNVCSEDKSNIYSLRSVNNFKNREDRKDDHGSSYHISNGLSQNDIIHGSYTTISSVSCSSSNATDISSSIYSFSHHKPLDDKGKRSIPFKASNTLVISPSHLRSKINAELVFQDTIGSALNHLQDLQNIKAISKAQDLTVNHPKLQDKCLNTENYGYTEESQSSLYKKKFQDDIKKMEREAQERIAKLEQDLKDKVEKMFDSASKGGTSKPDSRTCESLSKNKYSIDHTDEDSSSVSKESAKSLKKYMKLSRYDNQSGSSGKSDHSLHSVNSSSDAVLVTDIEDFSSKENTLKSQHHIIQSSNIQMDDMPKKQANLNDSSDMCDLKIFKNKTSSKSKYLQKVTTESCDKQTHTSGLLKSRVSTNQVQEKVPDSLSSINKDKDSQVFPKSDFTHPGFSSEHNPNENAIAQNVKSIDKDTDSKTLIQKESIYNSHRNAEILLESETFSKINEEKITAPVIYDSNPKYSKIRDESFSTYSEPFDSGGNNADLSLDPEEKSLLSSAEQKDTSFHSTQKYKEKLNDVNQDTFKSVRGGALQSMLNLLLSLQKEEEIRFKHQLAVFKLQEQFLIEEARLKLISANSEGGVNLRKRQRAIFLQLREQRSHIKRLIETQKLAAQQRQMFFNQHYNLLLSTSNSGNRVTPSRTHSPLPNNVEFSSSDGFENSSSTSSFSKGLRKIGQHYSLLKEDASYKNKNDLLSSSGIKEDSKPNLPIKKDMSKRRDESIKNDNLRTLNQDKAYVMKTDESDTSELEASRNFVPKRISYPNVNISSKEQKIKDNLLKEPDLNSNFSNTHESRSQIQVVAETRYLSNHRTAKTNIEFDLAHSNIKSSEKIKSSKETIVSEKICDVKSNILEEKTRRQSGGLPFALRYPLSPRSSIYYRRQSSESDDSFNLSQNDTISDISDYEGRLVALREDLVLRKTEAERLKKERRRIIKERISSQEQALRNQIAVYDNFIEQKKQEIDIESQKLLKVTSVKPLIKKPQASSTKAHHSESPSVNESVCNENLIDESIISDNTSTNISNESNLYDSLSGLNEGNVEVRPNQINKIEELHDSSKTDVSKENTSIASHSIVENLPSLHIQNQKQFTKEIETTSKPKVDLIFKKQQQERKQQPQQQQLQKQQQQQLQQKRQLEQEQLQQQQQVQNKKELQQKQLQQPQLEQKKLQQQDQQQLHLDQQKQLQEKRDQQQQVQEKRDQQQQVQEKRDQQQQVQEKRDQQQQVQEKRDQQQQVQEKRDQQQQVQEKRDQQQVQKDKQWEVQQQQQQRVQQDQQQEQKRQQLPQQQHLQQDQRQQQQEQQKPQLPQQKDQQEQQLSQHSHEQQQKIIIKLDKKPDVSLIDGVENLSPDLVDTRLLNKTNIENETPTQFVNEEKIVAPKEETKETKTSFNAHSEAVLVKTLDDFDIATVDVNKELKETSVTLVKDNVWLRKKANNLADYILDSLVSDSILCMRRLLRNKNKSQVIIFDIISQSDDPLVGCEALDKDFEAFVKTKTTVQNDVSSLDANYIPAAVESLPCEQNILEKSDDEEPEGRIDKQSSWFDESNRICSNYNGPAEFYKGTDINETFSVSSCKGDWLEDVFWKSDDNMKTKELREAEELINAEIARLEELQRFKEKYPNLVIREVPDKPPPPYTPPKDVATSTTPTEKLNLPEPQTPSNTISVPHRLSKADLRRIASDIVNVVPSKEELISAVENNCNLIYSEWQKGMNPAFVEYPALISISTFDVEEIDPSDSSEAAFNYLIFNLTRQYVCEVFDYVNAPPLPVWATHFHNPKKTNWKISKNVSEKSVVDHVMKNVRIDLGIDAPSKRESAMMKWALKRREPVDQIIVQEFQTEELSWVQYYEEEAFVKTQISKEILSSLIDETICVFNNILTKLL